MEMARPASLRLTGGAWRGRKIAIGDAPGLRPTPVRVRETLFNWLAPIIVGARCIDLFAGTGALGLEALSRGAAYVHFVEYVPEAAAAIHAALKQFGGGHRACVETGSALARLSARRADIVFIDPPFTASLYAEAITAVAPVLTADARLYLEYPVASKRDIERRLGNDFEILRSKRAGSVGYCLARAARAGEYSTHE